MLIVGCAYLCSDGEGLLFLRRYEGNERVMVVVVVVRLWNPQQINQISCKKNQHLEISN